MDYLKLLTKINANNKELYAAAMTKHLKYDLENTYRFIATCSVESGNFKGGRESLFYSTPSRLIQVYPSKFKNGGYNPNDYLKNSKKLANLVYSNKLGNGSEYSADGYNYRGGGLIQLTGKDWYKKLSEKTGIDFINKPDLIEIPEYSLISAIFYWDYNNIKNKKTLLDVRKAVNGPAALGYKEFVDCYNKLLK